MSSTKTKSVLVTGCSAGGIGAAIAHALAKRGHHVFATARTPFKIPETLRQLSNVTVLPLDVGDPASVAAASRAVTESGRGLDVLVNNAGVGYVRPVLDINIAAAQRLHDINLWGPLRTIQAFAELLIASRGRIVNVSSSAAVIYSPWICKFKCSAILTCCMVHVPVDGGVLTARPAMTSHVRLVQGRVKQPFRDAPAGTCAVRRERHCHHARRHRQQPP